MNRTILCCTILQIRVIIPLLAFKEVYSFILHKTSLTLSLITGGAFHPICIPFPSPQRVFFMNKMIFFLFTMLHIWVIFPLLTFKGVFSVLLFSPLHCRYCLPHLIILFFKSCYILKFNQNSKF